MEGLGLGGGGGGVYIRPARRLTIPRFRRSPVKNVNKGKQKCLNGV